MIASVDAATPRARTSRTRTVVPSLELTARVNKEIGQGSSDANGMGEVTIVFTV